MDVTPNGEQPDASSSDVSSPTPQEPSPTETQSAATAPDPADTIRCDQCGETVPDLPYCVRCGDPLGPERQGRTGRLRDNYAAAPGEKANAVRLVSTVFPALPNEEIRTFQLALIGGTLLVVALGLLGFFPVAIMAAAILVPLLVVLYLYDVDVYEDEPIRVIALTFLWGAVTGALFAFAVDRLFPANALTVVTGSITGADTNTGFPFARAVVAPLVSIVIMIAGPLVLLPYKRFNDVLDGATFGVASGVAFVGAQTLVSALDLFHGGLQPTGDVVPWVVRLLSLGVASPIIAAGAIGGLSGVLWLRYRAPVTDRSALGPFGQPVVAAVVAIVLIVGSALAVEALGGIVIGIQGLLTLVVQAVLAVLALIWLRRIIHLGLLQESREVPIGDPITCPNCGKQTPLHTFCGECGTSLRALPKSGAIRPAAEAGGLIAPHKEALSPEQAARMEAAGGGAALAAAGAVGSVAAPVRRTWLTQRNLLLIFAGVLLAVVAIAAVAAYVVTQGQGGPDCPDKTIPCASGVPSMVAAIVVPDTVVAPVADQQAQPFPAGNLTADESLGYSLEFDANWEVSQNNPGMLLLGGFGGAVALLVEGVPAQQMSVDQIFEARRSLLEQGLLGFAPNTDPDETLLGVPIVGHRPGKAGLFGGALDTPQGPSVDMSIAIVAATDGQITMVVTAFVPTEILDLGMGAADTIINSIVWPTDQVVP
jgi:hypothetical protein